MSIHPRPIVGAERDRGSELTFYLDVSTDEVVIVPGDGC